MLCSLLLIGDCPLDDQAQPLDITGHTHVFKHLNILEAAAGLTGSVTKSQNDVMPSSP